MHREDTGNRPKVNSTCAAGPRIAVLALERAEALSPKARRELLRKFKALFNEGESAAGTPKTP